MANTKISNLTGAASVTDASVFPVVDSGTTKKVTGLQIKTHARSGLSTVAVSGSYADLTNKPTLFDGNYNSLTNKPTLFDGNYNSLTSKPTLFSGAYTDLTGKPSLFSGSYIDLTNKPTIPSDVADLTDNNGLLGQGGGSGTGNLIITDTTITSNSNDIFIGAAQTASPAPGLYSFASDGSFNFPNSIKQETTTAIQCLSNLDTVVYTGNTTNPATFKIVMQVTGEEVYGTPEDTQSCELMIARNGSKVAGSVYGLVYTSTNPLATFTTRINNSGLVEVVCRPTSTTFTVYVRSFVTEIAA